MEKLMNNIQNKIDKLFDNLEESALYKDFVNIKEKLMNNKEIMNTINEIKRYQKLATNNKDIVLEKNIRELYTKLESYPLYQSYLIKKDELEEELYMVKSIFENYFKELLLLKWWFISLFFWIFCFTQGKNIIDY